MAHNRLNEFDLKALVGRRFGFLTVLDSYDLVDGNTQVLCKCDCGNVRHVLPYRLKTGHTKSCGLCKLATKNKKSKGAQNITGQRFNNLVAIKEAGRDNFGRAKWLFQCDCGNQVVASANNVKTGITKSCGCRKNIAYRRIDLTGQRFGRLRVLYYDKTENGIAYWICQCDCGKILSVRAAYLTFDKVKSCGCLYDDMTQDGMRSTRWANDNKTIYDRQCAKCGSKRNLHSHHIMPRNTHPELAENYANGITFCNKCHREFHGKYGFKCGVEELADFLGLDKIREEIIKLMIFHREKDGAKDIRKIIDYCQMILKYDYNEE